MNIFKVIYLPIGTILALNHGLLCTPCPTPILPQFPTKPRWSLTATNTNMKLYTFNTFLTSQILAWCFLERCSLKMRNYHMQYSIKIHLSE